MATSIKLDDELRDRVKRLAGAKRRTPHWIMRQAIAEYVAREEDRERFVQEAEVAWQAYRETGRHLTGDEALAWVRTWGTDDEKAMPECHK